MDEFSRTRGGQQFLYGTVPQLSKNIERLAAAVEKLTAGDTPKAPETKPLPAQLDYEDFYDVATYGNKAWKGAFTEAEVALNAYHYTVDYMESLKQHKATHTIEELYKLLKEDGESEYEYIRLELKPLVEAL